MRKIFIFASIIILMFYQKSSAQPGGGSLWIDISRLDTNTIKIFPVYAIMERPFTIVKNLDIRTHFLFDDGRTEIYRSKRYTKNKVFLSNYGALINMNLIRDRLYITYMKKRKQEMYIYFYTLDTKIHVLMRLLRSKPLSEKEQQLYDTLNATCNYEGERQQLLQILGKKFSYSRLMELVYEGFEFVPGTYLINLTDKDTKLAQKMLQGEDVSQYVRWDLVLTNAGLQLHKISENAVSPTDIELYLNGFSSDYEVEIQQILNVFE